MRQRARTSILYVVALSGLVACGEPVSSPQLDARASSSEISSAPDDYVQTPAGSYHRSCVHQIEDGARVGKGGVVRRRDGSTYQLPTCRYPILGRRKGGSLPPANNGWMEYAYDFAATSYTNLHANWHVPARPAGLYFLSTKVYYTFPGLQSNEFIIQPVLQYGYNGSFGSYTAWTIASWHCDDGPGCTHSTPMQTTAGHFLAGEIMASGCVNGDCTWTIQTIDVTTGTRTILTITDTDAYNWATGGAVEVYNLTSCSHYPPNGVFYTVYLYEASGQVTPSWSHFVQANPSPSCGFSVTSTPSTVNLYHN